MEQNHICAKVSSGRTTQLTHMSNLWTRRAGQLFQGRLGLTASIAWNIVNIPPAAPTAMVAL